MGMITYCYKILIIFQDADYLSGAAKMLRCSSRVTFPAFAIS